MLKANWNVYKRYKELIRCLTTQQKDADNCRDEKELDAGPLMEPRGSHIQQFRPVTKHPNINPRSKPPDPKPRSKPPDSKQ